MKKSLTLLMLTMVLAMTAQTTTPYYKNIKLSTIPIGTKNDSVVVWNGTTKLLKHIPVSEIKSAPATLQSVLNYNPSATSIDGINTVRILDVMGEQGYGSEFRSSSVNGTNIFSVDANSVTMYSGHSAGKHAYCVISGGKMQIEETGQIGGATSLEFTEPTIFSNLKFPAKIIAGIYTINTTPDTLYTVATLPAGLMNDMAIVTDATSPTYLGSLTGGGSVVCPVWNNGTTWVSR